MTTNIVYGKTFVQSDRYKGEEISTINGLAIGGTDRITIPANSVFYIEFDEAWNIVSYLFNVYSGGSAYKFEFYDKNDNLIQELVSPKYGSTTISNIDVKNVKGFAIVNTRTSSNQIYNVALEGTIATERKSLIYHDGEYKIWTSKTLGESEEVTSIPAMTSDTTPSGMASSSSFFNGDSRYMPYRAFNGVLDDANDAWISSTAYNEWIAYEFTSPIVINKYAISAGSSALNVMPKDFTFEGFDGSNWIVLDSRESITNWEYVKYITFQVKNNKPFIKYRLNVINNNGNGSYIGIADIKMFKATTGYQDDEKWISTNLYDINSNGMNSLSPIFDRRVETLEPIPMTDTSEVLQGEVGKVFSKTINLKKYIDIRTIKIEVN